MVGMNKHRFDLGTNFFNFDRRKKRKEELSTSYRIYILNRGNLNFYFYIIPSFSLQYSFFFSFYLS